MPRFNKGEWKFSYKDTFSLDMVLKPIIASGLKTFKQVIKSKNLKGIPINVISECEFYSKYENDISLNYNFTEQEMEIAEQLWYEILDKIIYAFDSEEPTWKSVGYDSKLIFIPSEKNSYGSIEFKDIKGNKQDWLDAVKLHNKKVEEGLQLFSKHFNNLWW